MAALVQLSEIVLPEQLGEQNFTGRYAGSYRVNPDLGSGSYEIVTCSDGLSVDFEEGNAGEDLRILLPRVNHPYITFVFQTLGRHGASTDSDSPLDLRGSALYAAHLVDQQEITLYRDQDWQAVSINAEPEFVRRYLDESDLLPLRVIERVLQATTTPRPLVSGPYDAQIAAALNHLTASRTLGSLRRFHTAAKAMELITLTLARIAQAEQSEQQPGRLRMSDIDRIHWARDILERELEDPPTIGELAERCGISATRLKWGFKAVFETTPFRYLRRVRMERARRLLEEGKTVLDVAVEVGYSNPSHFTRAFRLEMGVNPGLLKA